MTLLDIEPVFISTIFRYPDTLADLTSKVPADHIRDKSLRILYEAMIELFTGGHEVSAPAVYHRCKDKIQASLISDLLDNNIPSKNSLNHFVSEINLAAQKKRIESYFKRQINYLSNLPAKDILENLGQFIANETHQDVKSPAVIDAIKRHNEQVEQNKVYGVGKLTGYCFLDDHKHVRYSPCHVWAIGAFTSVGKTSFMIESIERAFSVNEIIKGMVISTEMDTNQNITRLITRKTGIHGYHVLSGNFREEGREKINMAKTVISRWDLKIYDDIYDLSEICTAVLKADMTGGVDVVWIDYLQNITVKDATSEYQATDKISKEIQKLAKKCKCTIVLFSQLSNDAAKDDNGVLQFKGSGTIAAVADRGFIMKRDKDDKSKVLFDMRKNRHGPLGKQVLQFVDNFTRLQEIYDDANE